MPDRAAPEVAEAEFERFAATWRIDTEVETMGEEDRNSFESLKRKLVRSIARGDLTVDETGDELTYTLQFPQTEGLTELKFNVPRGSAVTGWDRFKEREAIKKLNSYMGSMCKQGPAVFTQMDGRDLKIAQGVAQLFLGS